MEQRRRASYTVAFRAGRRFFHSGTQVSEKELRQIARKKFIYWGDQRGFYMGYNLEKDLADAVSTS